MKKMVITGLLALGSAALAQTAGVGDITEQASTAVDGLRAFVIGLATASVGVAAVFTVQRLGKRGANKF